MIKCGSLSIPNEEKFRSILNANRGRWDSIVVSFHRVDVAAPEPISMEQHPRDDEKAIWRNTPALEKDPVPSLIDVYQFSLSVEDSWD